MKTKVRKLIWIISITVYLIGSIVIKDIYQLSITLTPQQHTLVGLIIGFGLAYMLAIVDEDYQIARIEFK